MGEIFRRASGAEPAQDDAEVPCTWRELLPRQKAAVYEFVAEVKTLSLEDSKALCLQHPVDAAFIANAIRENFGLSRKWRASLNATIPLEAWTASKDVPGIRTLSDDLDSELHLFAEHAGVSEIRQPAGLESLRGVHLKLSEGVPPAVQQKYSNLIRWMDRSNLAATKAHPLLEFGGICQLSIAVEHLYSQTCTYLSEFHFSLPAFAEQLPPEPSAPGGRLSGIEFSAMSDYAAKALKWVVLRTQVSVNCYNEAVSRCLQALKRFEGPDLHAPSDSNLAKRADNEQDPGLLIVSLLCDLAINRVLRENNRVRKLQIRAGHIAAEFLNWSDTNLHDRDWDLQLMLGEESRKAWVEANFGKGSRYALASPKQELTSAQISALIRTSNAIAESEIATAKVSGVALQEDAFYGASLLAFCACYFTGSEVQSDKHGKATVRTVAGRTAEHLDSWVPSAEGRMLIKAVIALFYEALRTNLLAPVHVFTSSAILSYRTLFKNELLYRVFKGVGIEAHRAHYEDWKRKIRDLTSDADDAAVARFNEEDDFVQFTGMLDKFMQ